MTTLKPNLLRRVIYRIGRLTRYQLPSTADMQAAIRLLNSPYRSLIGDRNLQRDMTRLPLYPVTVLDTTGKWLHLRIHDFVFWWPREYSTRDLPWIYHEVFTPATANPHAYESSNISIRAGDWVVDAGASEGFFTHYALQRGARVVCVEPVPLLAEALRRTFADQVAANDVEIVAAALGSSPGRINLAVQSDEVYAAHVSTMGAFETPVVTLDEIARTTTDRKIGFIKMDVEGSEIDAIAGSHHLLARDRPTLSIAVYHEEGNARVLRREIARQHPHYEISWRGVWTARSKIPRPYMLFARPDR